MQRQEEVFQAVKQGERPASSRSPWAPDPTVKRVRISPPGAPVDVATIVPGSKSYTNRALLLAGVAAGTSSLRGLLRSDDSYWCVDCLRRLGLAVTIQGESAEIGGCAGSWPITEASLYLGSSGTLARFLPGLLAGSARGRWTVDGSDQLRRRPLGPLVEALQALGGRVIPAPCGKLPLQVEGGGLAGGAVAVPGDTSSQFISGLLMAAPLARSAVEVSVTEGLVQPAYVGITINLMRRFGARVEADSGYRRLRVEPGGYQGRSLSLEGDASSAAYLLALAALTGGRVVVENVGYDSLQPDARFVDLLEKMGCQVVRGESALEVRGAKALRGGFTADMTPMSDQALTLGVLGSFADHPVTVVGVGHIRQHESDRIAVFCQQMSKLGIEARERDDGFTVYPGQHQQAVIDPHDDHRVAMAFALVGARVPGVVIDDPACVGKTYPGYFQKLADLGLRVDFVRN